MKTFDHILSIKSLILLTASPIDHHDRGIRIIVKQSVHELVHPGSIAGLEKAVRNHINASFGIYSDLQNGVGIIDVDESRRVAIFVGESGKFHIDDCGAEWTKASLFSVLDLTHQLTELAVGSQSSKDQLQESSRRRRSSERHRDRQAAPPSPRKCRSMSSCCDSRGTAWSVS